MRYSRTSSEVLSLLAMETTNRRLISLRTVVALLPNGQPLDPKVRCALTRAGIAVQATDRGPEERGALERAGRGDGHRISRTPLRPVQGPSCVSSWRHLHYSFPQSPACEAPTPKRRLGTADYSGGATSALLRVALVKVSVREAPCAQGTLGRMGSMRTSPCRRGQGGRSRPTAFIQISATQEAYEVQSMR